MTELRALIEDVKEYEISMYKFFTDAEITEKKKRIAELEAEQ